MIKSLISRLKSKYRKLELDDPKLRETVNGVTRRAIVLALREGKVK